MLYVTWFTSCGTGLKINLSLWPLPLHFNGHFPDEAGLAGSLFEEFPTMHCYGLCQYHIYRTGNKKMLKPFDYYEILAC